MTVYLRATSVKTGQVLLSVVATKKILSYGIDANAFRYVTFNRILQAEVGVTRNEPGSLAVEQSIEQAVLQLIVEGSARGLWGFQDREFQSRIIEDYELSYLQVAQANAAGPGNAPANNGQNGGTATAQNGKPPAEVKPASAPAKPNVAPAQGQAAAAPAPGQAQGQAAAAVNAAKPIQWAALNAPGAAPQQGPQPQPNQPQGAPQMQPQPAPQIVVLPKTLEDEAPIAPR